MLLPHQLCPPLGKCNSIHHEHGRWGCGEGSGKKEQDLKQKAQLQAFCLSSLSWVASATR